MAFIKLKCENPNLSYILSKNPQTQIDSGEPFYRNTKTYQNALWYEEGNTVVNIYAKPFESNRSDLGYMDYHTMCSGQSYTQLINSMASSIINKDLHEFDNVECEVEFSVIYMDKFKLIDYFDHIKEESIEGEIRKIKIVSPTVRDAFELIGVISILSSARDKETFVVNEAYIKFAKNICKFTESYQMLKRVFTLCGFDKKMANDLRNNMPNMKYFMHSINSAQCRIESYFNTMDSIKRSETIIDLGCGGFAYLKKHVKLYKNVIGIEIDTAEYEYAKKTIAKIGAEERADVYNVDILAYINSCLNHEEGEPADILLTEVLEHMEYDLADEVMTTLSDAKFNNMIITLPNKDFNHHFGLSEDEFRHDDHDWEPGYEKVCELVQRWEAMFPDHDVVLEFVGDYVINNPTECVTFKIVFTPKEV